MKTLFIIIQLSLIFLVTRAQDPEIKLPAEIRNKFNAEFVNASSITWKLGSQSGNYEADFIDEGAHKRIRYSDKGIILVSETNLFPGQLPHHVKQTMEKNFTGYSIEQIRKIQTSKHGTIKIRVSKKNDRYEVEIDLSGSVISKRKIRKVYKEEEDDDDDHDRKHKYKKKHKHDDDHDDD